MLDQQTRTAILHLRSKGHSLHKISKTVKVSRKTVRLVLRSGTSEVPPQKREEKLTEHLERIRQLHASCKGNRVRVWEELEAEGVEVAYSTLTGFCRRHNIGVKEKVPAGRYHFGPGEEMQHDTSPHDVKVGDKVRKLQCASLVLCFSRMLYAQAYPRFDRFWCKVFLTEALRYFQGAAAQCMVDNTAVVIVYGTGKDAVAAPEMAAFSDHFGFKIVAHAVGHANRSGRVERPFDYIENNFYPGRTFADIGDLNNQMRAWCDKVNHRYKKHICSVPIELYQLEREHLKPLPIFIPDVYQVHFRVVDVEGYVTVHTNRYSAPWDLIGRQVEVRETQSKITIQKGAAVVCEHQRREDGLRGRFTLPQHEHAGRHSRAVRKRPTIEEQTLRNACPELCALVKGLKRRHRGRAVRPVRRLHRMYLEYPTEPLQQACREALQYGLWDLERIETMVLKKIAGEFFRLGENKKPEHEND